MPKRVLVLPPRGTLLINTDLHGNGEDFRQLKQIFLKTRQRDPEAHWVILGDVVHGPSERARKQHPTLYDYPDESWNIVEGILELKAHYPGFVHFVLGNHDYGHLGGPRTSKFYPDEVKHLESTLTEPQRAALRSLFQDALLAVLAPCGAFLSHGAPDDTLRSLKDLDAISLPPAPGQHYHRALLRGLLLSYGQPGEVMERFLAVASKDGVEVRFVIHGHDKDESGFFLEGGNQLCPVIFGAPRQNKRYVMLDLSAQYLRVEDLRNGVEIKKLYP